MKKRILFVFIIIIFTSTFIFSIISSRIYYEKFLEDAKNNLYIYMNQYSEEFSWDVAGAKSYSRKLNGVRVTFIDKNGEVIGDSEENLPLDNHLNREEVKIASLEGEGFAIRKSDTLAQQMVYFCKSVNNGYVRVAVKTSTYSQIFIDSIPSLIWFFIIEIIVCLLFTWILVDYIIKPIEKLSIEGASGQKVSSTYPEFSQIVKIINNMNERIDDKISKIKEDKKIENIVLNNMEHGIIILGLDNHLILANNIVNELFGYSEVGENLPFFKDDQEILEGIEQEEQFLFYRKKNDKEYAIRFTKSENAKVILVTDVTEIKRMENKRYTLSKEERLSWKRYIDLLFEKGQSFVAFPLRVVYLPLEEEMSAPVSILISVPKKKFKRAVKRNLIKRQVREAYRVRKYDLIDPLTEKNKRMLIAFLYLDKEIHPFTDMEKAMTKAIRILRDKE